MSPELKELLDKAFGQAKHLRQIGVDIVDDMTEGVDFMQASQIIDKYWVGRDAARLKLMLSSQFPRRNSDMLLVTPFGDKVGQALSFAESQVFFEAAIPAISQLVEAKLEEYNKADMHDSDVLASFNDFRKEPARFVNYMNDGWFDGREALMADDIQTWDQLKQEAPSVENGDYLFMENHRKQMDEMLEYVQRYFNDKLDGLTNKTLNGVEWFADQIIIRLRLCDLFLQFLDQPIKLPVVKEDPQ